ncbi:hypothetical protein EJB05_15038, partial [Eragrostis curvula]
MASALPRHTESSATGHGDVVPVDNQINPPPRPTDALPAPEKIAECPVNKIHYVFNLAEFGSDLLIIGYRDVCCTGMVIYRLSDLLSGKDVPVTSIGDNALFVDERCLCVSSTKGLPSVPRNSIVCIRTWGCGPRSEEPDCFEQYSLETGTWSQASDGDVLQRPPPSPHTLIHHIFTCCHQKQSRIGWSSQIGGLGLDGFFMLP